MERLLVYGNINLLMTYNRFKDSPDLISELHDDFLSSGMFIDTTDNKLYVVNGSKSSPRIYDLGDSNSRNYGQFHHMIMMFLVVAFTEEVVDINSAGHLHLGSLTFFPHYEPEDIYDYIKNIATNENVCDNIFRIILENGHDRADKIMDIFLKAISEVNTKLYKKLYMEMKLVEGTGSSL